MGWGLVPLFFKKYKGKKISGVESRNSERAFNCAFVFADTMFFQGHRFTTLHNKIGDLVK